MGEDHRAGYRGDVKYLGTNSDSPINMHMKKERTVSARTTDEPFLIKFTALKRKCKMLAMFNFRAHMFYNNS